MGRPVVYLACWKKHISLYTVPRLDEALDVTTFAYGLVNENGRLKISSSTVLSSVTL